MPTYEYRCRACGHELEVFQSMTDGPKRKCPACKALKLQRQIGTGAGILFKGSGFYQTDYRTQSYRDGQAAEDKSSKDASADSSKKDSATKKDSSPKKDGDSSSPGE